MTQNEEDKQYPNPMRKFKTTASEFNKEVASPQISNYIDKCIQCGSNPTTFPELLKCKVYIERMGLKEYWWERYIKVQQKLKDIALMSEGLQDNENEKEAARYDWLKICVNPEKNVNYDFYFETKGLDHEEEVKKILFDEKGALRDIFNKSDDWQIRLRKIKIWFLKRYDWRTAFRIWRNLKNKRMFDFVDLIFPRLLCAILIGILPLMAEEAWRLPLALSCVEIGVIALGAFTIIILYFLYECFKTDRKKSVKSLLPRVLIIGLWGAFASLVFSTIFCSVFSHHFIDFENAVHDGVCYVNWALNFLAFHGKIIIFFATTAFLIGTLIQVVWEEKTVTEPL